MNMHRETIRYHLEKRANVKSRVGEGFNNLRDALTYGANEAVRNIVCPVRRFKLRKRELPKDLNTLRKDITERRNIKKVLKGKDTDPIQFEYIGFPKGNTINSLAKSVDETPETIRKFLKADLEQDNLRIRRNLAGMAGDVAAVGAYGYGGYKGTEKVRDYLKNKKGKK